MQNPKIIRQSRRFLLLSVTWATPVYTKGEMLMKQKEHINGYEAPILDEEAVYAEYVKKDIIDDFIFGKVMQKKENCIGLLECLTGNRIEDVNAVTYQKSVKVTSDSKGVRYDIYVEDDKERIYDAEMQNYSKGSEIKQMPKRVRFYQGMIDLNILQSGADYCKLKESYVIFICTFDPFGRELCCYEFENVCKYDEKIKLNDKRKVLIFNTKGTVANVSKPTKDFLDYLETKKVTDDFTKRIDSEVALARQNREWMVEYMKTLVHDMDVRNQGIMIGISDSIIEFLSEHGDIPQNLRDRIYQEEDIEKLKQWNKLSARVSSIEEFVREM